jgi:hypothetical protein
MVVYQLFSRFLLDILRGNNNVKLSINTFKLKFSSIYYHLNLALFLTFNKLKNSLYERV